MGTRFDTIERMARTLWQGVGIDCLVAAASVVAVSAGDLSSWQGVSVVGASVGRTVLQVAAAYVMARYRPPAGMPKA
jgi:hypothetical protein